jgi:hypothetical protein
MSNEVTITSPLQCLFYIQILKKNTTPIISINDIKELRPYKTLIGYSLDINEIKTFIFFLKAILCIFRIFL